MAITGLFLEPDSAPYTSTSLDTTPLLIDGDRFTLAGGDYWHTHYAYGLDFGVSTTISGMSVYGIVAASTPTDWYSSSNDSFSVYKSDDNSTWTLVESFDGPPLIHLAALQWGFELAFSANQTARFFKIVYTDSTTMAFQPGELSGGIGEIVPHLVGIPYTNKLVLTIDGSKVDEDLTDFPVNITLSSGTGINNFNSSLVFDELLNYTDYSNTWNPDDAHAYISFTNGNLNFTQSNGGYVSARSYKLVTSGKWYWEHTIVGTRDQMIGIADSNSSLSLGVGRDPAAESWGWRGYYNPGSLFYHDSSINYGSQWSVSDIISVALDMDNGKVWFAQNGSWVTGDPALGTSPAASGISGEIYAMASVTNSPSQISVNFGNSSFTHSIPSGFSAFDTYSVIDENNNKKLAITDSNDTQLYVEIENWDWINKEASLWTKVPTIVSGTNTPLYLYYDSNFTENIEYVGYTGQYQAQAVWDDDFMAVWHMSQNPAPITDVMIDSTLNKVYLTSGGSMTSDDLVDGLIIGGKAIAYDGSDDFFVELSAAAFDIDTFTIETIINVSDTGEAQCLLQYGSTSANISYRWVVAATDQFNIQIGYSTGSWENGYSTNTIDFDTNQFIAVTKSGNDYEHFKNGEPNGSGTHTNAQRTGTKDLYIGKTEFGATDYYFLNGIQDELRFSSTVRSDAWVKATYYSNTNNLMTFAVAEGIYFYFSSPNPADLATVYGTSHTLYLTTTVTGNASEYLYDATFYNAYDDSVIGTVSGIQSGYPADALISTPSGINYQWYITATSSGSQDTSDVYTFINRFMCSGQTQINNTAASGIPVRLYLRETGEYIGEDTSAGVSGTFYIETPHNDYHYAVALYDLSNTNAVIADWLIPE